MFNFLQKKPAHYISAIIPAAGQSRRMGDIDKMFVELDDMPIIAHTLTAFEKCRQISEVVLVVPEEYIPDYVRLVGDYHFGKVAVITKGGETRQQSVAMGIEHVNTRCEYILVHDGARPFVAREVLEDCIRGAVSCGAATAAVPVKDTIKQADQDGFVAYTQPREQLYLTQTPQAFEVDLYRDALNRASDDYTDDCQLVEAMGHKVLLTRGSYLNIKITMPEDLILAEGIYDHWED